MGCSLVLLSLFEIEKLLCIDEQKSFEMDERNRQTTEWIKCYRIFYSTGTFIIDNVQGKFLKESMNSRSVLMTLPVIRKKCMDVVELILLVIERVSKVSCLSHACVLGAMGFIHCFVCGAVLKKANLFGICMMNA